MSCVAMQQAEKAREQDLARLLRRSADEVHAAMHAALEAGDATTVFGALAFVELTLALGPEAPAREIEMARLSLDRSAGAGRTPLEADNHIRRSDR